MASFKTEVQGGGYGAQGLFLKHGGQWKVVTDVYCKRGGQWVEMQAGWVGYFGNSVKFWPPDNKLGSGGASDVEPCNDGWPPVHGAWLVACAACCHPWAHHRCEDDRAVGSDCDWATPIQSVSDPCVPHRDRRSGAVVPWPHHVPRNGCVGVGEVERRCHPALHGESQHFRTGRRGRLLHLDAQKGQGSPQTLPLLRIVTAWVLSVPSRTLRTSQPTRANAGRATSSTPCRP